jgi:arsenate reductase
MTFFKPASPRWTLYFNPACKTCRNVLSVLQSADIEPRIIEYLKTPPTLAELKGFAEKLGSKWSDLVRTGEPIYAGLKLTGRARSEVLKAVAENPILLQRPIVIHGDRVIVARPFEKVRELIDEASAGERDRLRP